eukprot:gnl/MRDRNA2_/MRDRNA2_88600_c0_seq1.p1 gnl/MRDRNA2_/MRDRNA2_88600_c0~~gnl/MRDRNA2_/MRDRNA2_88600_c0_seq1.p1  ORF type:complete len:186 (+),score=35.14 gnl/MRDRNA2_/MRDRNA2_88600_c0_seq1:78-560(+)
MAELIACAAAVVVTPPVLFGIEQTEKALSSKQKPDQTTATQDQSVGDKVMAWTDQVDKGACFLDQLLLQRSSELKRAVSELIAPTTRTSKESSQESSGRKGTATLNDLLNSPQDENTTYGAHQDSKGPDVWVKLGSQVNKASAQKASPEVSYIFVPARAA